MAKQRRSSSDPDQNIIYGLVDPRNNHLRYIGLSTWGIKRARSHLREVKNGKHVNPHLTNWINQLIKENLKPETIMIEENHPTCEALSEAERFWILYFTSIGAKLTNVKEGGFNGKMSPEVVARSIGRNKGRVVSEETKAKISNHWKENTHPNKGKRPPDKTIEAMRKANIGRTPHNKGKSPTQETRVKISISGIGRNVSQETRDKISATLSANGHGIGVKHSEETKAKQSAAKLGKNHPNWGKQLSPEVRAKISATNKITKAKKKKE